MSFLDAILGRIRNRGTSLDIQQGLDFKAPLTATSNESTGFIDIDIEEIPVADIEPISPGEVLGLQVDAPEDAAPVPITGAEQGENLRVNTITVPTVSTTHDPFDIGDNINSIAFQNATVIVDGITARDGGLLCIRHTGTGSTTIRHNAGSNSSEQISIPGAQNLTLINFDQVFLLYHNGKWRPYGLATNALVRQYAGSGSPEGVVTAATGSLYLNFGGGAGTTLFIKESGSGNTGWVGK